MADKPNSKSHATNNDTLSEQRRRIEAWSREILDVQEAVGDGSGEIELSPIMHRLVRHRFLLPPASEAALRVLWDDHLERPNVYAWEEVRAQRHRRLNHQIESFARQFFGLSVEQRRCDWNKLSNACEDFPLLKFRVERLYPGIDAVAGDTHRELLEPGAIGDVFQQLFVASRSEWLRIRRRFRDRIATQSAQAIEEAARSLQQHHPRIAALQPELFEELYNNRAHERRRARTRASRLHAIRKFHEPTSVGRVVVVAFASIAILFFVFNMGNAALDNSRWRRGHVRDNPSPQRSPVQPQASATQDLLLGARPGEQALDVALRLVIEDPENPIYRHTLGKELIQAALASFGNTNGVASFRLRSDDEREEFYLRACQVLQQLVAEQSASIEYSTTFFEACQRYGEHPKYLRVLHDRHPDHFGLPLLQKEYFQQLAETHLQRTRPREALRTMMAEREFSRRDPKSLLRLSHKMAHVAHSQLRNDALPRDQELVDACAFGCLITLVSAFSECLRQLPHASDDGTHDPEAMP